jgi:hypothetical protein
VDTEGSAINSDSWIARCNQAFRLYATIMPDNPSIADRLHFLRKFSKNKVNRTYFNDNFAALFTMEHEALVNYSYSNG